MPNFQEPLEIETDVSGYALGVVLMQGWRHVSYHSYLFHGLVLDYPTYHKEIFVSVQELEALLTRKRDHYTHRSSASSVCIETGQDAKSEAL
jgi:hypothetical protein